MQTLEGLCDTFIVDLLTTVLEDRKHKVNIFSSLINNCKNKTANDHCCNILTPDWQVVHGHP